jgi:conjugative transfer signal peptidase TraF
MKSPKLISAVVLSSALFLVRVNVSSSLPKGIYCRLPRQKITQGALVGLCLPGSAAALYRAHAHPPSGSCADRLPPFLKAVAAQGGDLVNFGPQGLRVGGELLPLSAPRLSDSAGLPLPHAPYGTYRLPPDSIWLYAPEPSSFDSRYFGPQPTPLVLYRLMPLWLFGPMPPACRIEPFHSRLEWSRHHV